MIPEAWIGREVMIDTTEALSSDLRAAAPVYLEDVNDRGVVMLVTRHSDQSQVSRYFYPWSVVGWIRLAEEDERAGTAGLRNPRLRRLLGTGHRHPWEELRAVSSPLDRFFGGPRVQWARGLPDNG